MTHKQKTGGKQAIIRDVMAKGFTARKAAKAVDTVFRVMAKELSYHESVEVPGIGTLLVAVYNGRPKRRRQKSRNVQTKATQVHDVEFPGRRRVVKLKPDPTLKLPLPQATAAAVVLPNRFAVGTSKPKPVPMIAHAYRAGLAPKKPRRC